MIYIYKDGRNVNKYLYKLTEDEGGGGFKLIRSIHGLLCDSKILGGLVI